MTLLAIAGATIFTLLALLHVTWAFSDRAPGAVVPTRHDGEPLFRPSRAQTLAVAAALTLAAYIVLERGGPGPGWLPPWARAVGAWGLAMAMLARGIGDFRYVGLFKRHRDSAFARQDTRLFTPLVLVLALVSGLIAALGR